MRSGRSTQAGVAVFVGVVFSYAIYLLGCDSTKPTQPQDHQAEDYLVWIRTYDKHTLYAYHSLTGQIDTVDIPWELNGADITVSHDGQLLYIPSNTLIRVYDTETHALVTELPYFTKRPVVVSPCGRYIAITSDSVRILRTSDYTQIYMDTTPALTGCFSADGQNLYTVSGNVVRTSLSDPADIKATLLFQQSGLMLAIPTPEESKLLLYMALASFTYAFAAYDIAGDSLLATDFQVPGVGRVAMTPDGQYAYYGNPGNMMAGPIPPSEITEFDVTANEVAQRISTRHFIDSVTPDFMPIGHIAITPDGRWLVAMMGPIGSGGSGAMLKYDLVDRRMVDYYDFANLTYGISVQLVP